MSYESGQVTANISGSVTTTAAIPVPSAAQAATIYRTTGNGAAQTIFTVAAGTRFLLYGASITHNAASQCTIYADDGATGMWLVYGAANDTGQVSAAVPVHSYPANTAVKGVATNTAQYCIWGIVETL